MTGYSSRGSVNDRRGQPFSPAAQLKRALSDLEEAKCRIANLELQLATRQAHDMVNRDAQARKEEDSARDRKEAEVVSTSDVQKEEEKQAEVINEDISLPPEESETVEEILDTEEKGEDEQEDEGEEIEEALKVAQDEVEQLKKQLEKIEIERDGYQALAGSIKSDLEAYKNRIQKEMALMKRDSLAGFLKNFLSSFDDLDRVIKEMEKDPAAQTACEGIKLARENLWQTLAFAGVGAINPNPEDEVFDPQKHEVIAAIPSAGKQEDSILEVFQLGYALDDFILRPAKVVVVKNE